MVLEPALAAVGGEAVRPAARAAGFSESAAERLGGALARPGRLRDSAFELLAADALATYACEAALDDLEPEQALAEVAARLLGAGAGS